MTWGIWHSYWDKTTFPEKSVLFQVCVLAKQAGVYAYHVVLWFCLFSWTMPFFQQIKSWQQFSFPSQSQLRTSCWEGMQCKCAEIGFFWGPCKTDCCAACSWVERKDCVPCNFDGIMCHDRCKGDPWIGCGLKRMMSLVHIHRNWSQKSRTWKRSSRNEIIMVIFFASWNLNLKLWWIFSWHKLLPYIPDNRYPIALPLKQWATINNSL